MDDVLDITRASKTDVFEIVDPGDFKEKFPSSEFLLIPNIGANRIHTAVVIRKELAAHIHVEQDKVFRRLQWVLVGESAAVAVVYFPPTPKTIQNVSNKIWMN